MRGETQTSTATNEEIEATLPIRTDAHETRRQQEFEALFTKTRKRAYNLAYRLVGNAAQAEDVAQDAYFRAWVHFDEYDRARPFEAWLARILTNLVIDRYRRQQRLPTRSFQEPQNLPPGEKPIYAEAIDEDSNPETLLMADALDERLEKALNALPPDHRMAILLADVEERPYQEIADILDCPVGTIRSRIHRGRIALRRMLLENVTPRRRSRPARSGSPAIRHSPSPC